MTTASSGGAGVAALAQRLEPLRSWWRTLALREQRLVLLAGTLLALLLLWLVAIRPAWATLRQAPVQLDALDVQWQTMQQRAAEARELRAAPAVTAAQSTTALQAATERLGDGARLTIQADRAVLSVTGIDSASLRLWMAEVRNGARARPVEAQLARGPRGFTGTVTVSIVGAP